MARIVVGVDGSAHSLAALRWAFDEAVLRGADLQVVMAWDLPEAFGVELGSAAAFGDAATEIERAHAARLERAVDSLGAGPGGMRIERVLLQEDAAGALVRTARGADLLVVGSRGHGAIRRMVLGSVSAACVAHAPCPVAVIGTPHPSTERSEPRRFAARR